jgi:hypothetical protein
LALVVCAKFQVVACVATMTTMSEGLVAARVCKSAFFQHVRVVFMVLSGPLL